MKYYNKYNNHSYRPPPWANNSGRREDSWANGSRSSSPPRSSRSWQPPKRKYNGNSHHDSSKRSRSEGTPKGIQMLVTSRDFPSKHLSEEQLELVQSTILTEIGKIDPTDFCPQFLDSFKRRGNLIIMCNNQESVDWLKSTIPTLKPWEEAELKTLDPSELPNLMDFLVMVPGDVDVEVFLRRVDKQNENLNATNWNLTSKKKDDTERNTILTFTVEETASDNIKKTGFKIFYNFTRLNIKYLGSLRNKEDKKGDDKKENEQKSESEEKKSDDGGKETADGENAKGENAESENAEGGTDPEIKENSVKTEN